MVALDTMVVDFMQFSNDFMAANVEYIYIKLSHMVMPMLASIVTIMLIMQTFHYHQNIGAAFVKSLFNKIIALGFIYACLLNWDLVTSLFVDTWSGMSQGVAANILTHFSGVHDSLPVHLQKVLMNASMSVNDFLKNGSVINIGPWVVAGVMFFFVVGAITILIVEIMIAKIAMMLLVGLLPLILPFILFDATKGIFERAIGFLTSSAFVVVFAAFASVLVIGICDRFLNVVIDKNSFAGLIPTLLVGSFCMCFAVVAFKMGKDIGGSVSLSSGSGGTMGDMAGHSRRPMGAMSNAGRALSSGALAGSALGLKKIGGRFLKK